MTDYSKLWNEHHPTNKELTEVEDTFIYPLPEYANVYEALTIVSLFNAYPEGESFRIVKAHYAPLLERALNPTNLARRIWATLNLADDLSKNVTRWLAVGILGNTVPFEDIVTDLEAIAVSHVSRLSDAGAFAYSLRHLDPDRVADLRSRITGQDEGLSELVIRAALVESTFVCGRIRAYAGMSAYFRYLITQVDTDVLDYVLKEFFTAIKLTMILTDINDGRTVTEIYKECIQGWTDSLVRKIQDRAIPDCTENLNVSQEGTESERKAVDAGEVEDVSRYTGYDIASVYNLLKSSNQISEDGVLTPTGIELLKSWVITIQK